MDRRKFVRDSLAAASAVTASAGLARAAQAAAPRPLSAVTGFTFARLRYASGNWDADPKMPANLLHSLAEYASIRIDPQERIVDVGSERLADYPFVYLTGNKMVRFSEAERLNLRRYLRTGGFMFVDDCNHDLEGAFARSFEAELKLILDRPEEALRKLPATHPLYSSFFNFDDGPPATSHELNGLGDDVVHDYLRAAEVDGRVVVLYSNKDYGCEWNYDPANKRFSASDDTRFGVNIIVYALTH